jgi:imidazolonepropionase-like amidohydrolase
MIAPVLLPWIGMLLQAASLLEPGKEVHHPYETDSTRMPTLQTGGNCVIRGATIHSAVGPPVLADVLVREGNIAAIGDVEAPADFLVIDAVGMHLAPGVVDNHSHIAIEGGVNEGTLTITADVDISDVVNADDVAIYRALAGGVTMARLLHGSANAIGGRHEVIKLRWGKRASDLRFPEAPEGVKFALGENPKRSNYGRSGERFPDTRMGVEAALQRGFERAREYQSEWKAYESERSRGGDPRPPRRDLRLEALAAILEGRIDVHAHCYRADEILMLLRCAERFGFQVKTLQHVLEGYKVASEISQHGAGASTFGDWWAYKVEAYDAIPHNAALLDEAAVLTSLNSDSSEMMRRLYGEAAKSVRYAGMDPVRALALVTINSAAQLGIAEHTGSIEVGKDADLVLLNGDPLSSLARVEWTMVDGEIEFQRADPFGFAERPAPTTPFEELAEELGEAPNQDLYSPSGGEVVAITGGTLHPIGSPDIPGGTLLMQAGRIVRMGKDVEIPSSARIVDASGKDVWPGLVAAYTALGLFEINSVRGTDDMDEIGGNQPDIRVAASLNADSAHIPVTRYNGVTRSQSAPNGGGPLAGQSAIIRLKGDTWEELLMRDADMMHVRYPSVDNRAEEKEEGDELKELKRLFEDAREYARARAEVDPSAGNDRPRFDSRLEALAPYALGEKKVAIHADNAQTILFALRFAQEQKLDAVLFGVREGWKVAEAIANSGFPCVVGPVLALPLSAYDPYDSVYANAALLHRSGVPFAIMSADAGNPRNLAFHAAMACAFGLPREEALRAITLYPARILGIGDQVGSLAVGKLADVIVTAGDLLEIRSPVEHVFIEGVAADMETRHTRLYQRYRERLVRQLEK